MTKVKKKRGPGRPKRIYTDEQIEQIQQLAKLNLHTLTIAEALDIPFDELQRHFAKIMTKKRAEGKCELKRWQRDQAEKNIVMAIWLGKQDLGQADKQELGGIGGKVLIPKIILFGDRDKDKKQIVDS